MILKPNEFGNLALDELEAFEKENNMKLPIDYREFLLKYNGGEPLPNVNIVPRTIVDYVFGMHNGDYFASLYRHIEVFNKRIPFDSFPIAKDAGGNLFIMSIHPESYGYIYFWDHEGEPEVQDGHYIENCTFVAYTFSRFINSLG